MAGCICIPYIYNWQIKNSSEVGTAGMSINKSLAGEGKIRKSFKPHIRNNYVHRYKSTVVQWDKHTEGDPGAPLRVGGCSPTLPSPGNNGCPEWRPLSHCGKDTVRDQDVVCLLHQPAGQLVGSVLWYTGTCGPCPSGWSGVTSRGRARGRCACGLEGRSWPCNKPTVLCQSKAFSYGLHPSSWGQEAAGHGRYSPSVPLTVWGAHAQPHSDIPPWEV